MKVKMLVTLAGVSYVRDAGTVHDIEDEAEAIRLVEAGIAERVQPERESAVISQPETAALPSPRKRK